MRLGQRSHINVFIHSLVLSLMLYDHWEDATHRPVRRDLLETHSPICQQHLGVLNPGPDYTLPVDMSRCKTWTMIWLTRQRIGSVSRAQPIANCSFPLFFSSKRLEEENAESVSPGVAR